MGFRMRKSFTVMPGVRMTVTPRGISTSVGGKAGRVTVNSQGRVTQTVRIPGTGISHVSTSSVRTARGAAAGRPTQRTTTGRTASAPAAVPTAPPAPKKPGLFSPAWHKALYRVLEGHPDPTIADVARLHPEARMTCMLLEVFAPSGAYHDERGKTLLEELWASGYDPARDTFLTTYAPYASGSVEVTPGIEATLPLGRTLLGLALAERRQEVGDLAGAVALVESLEPTTLAAVSLAELYTAQGRWNDVVEFTNEVDGTDDFACFLLSQRGIAFRELGYYEASREAFKRSLARRSQSSELKHHTLAQRALTYLAEGKKSMARKDYERILVDDPHFPGLTEALAALG